MLGIKDSDFRTQSWNGIRSFSNRDVGPTGLRYPYRKGVGHHSRKNSQEKKEKTPTSAGNRSSFRESASPAIEGYGVWGLNPTAGGIKSRRERTGGEFPSGEEGPRFLGC